jgi:adenine-specific DNA-methyltransferase
LDFFGGTGTTAAVAHKLRRRYIVCEQLDKHIDICLRRMNKVIEGEQSGISKKNNWQGGGSFVYCELAKLNQKYVDRIQIAENDKELADIWREIKKTGFISCYVNPQDINPEAEDFKSLSFEEKKRLFVELLDKNQLYVNYCDIDDEDYNISDADKAFTKSFYEGV